MTGEVHVTAVVFDLGNVLVGWDPYLPLADRMTREEWERFAREADFGRLNAMADGGVPVADLVRRAAEADPSHGELIGRYFDRFGLSLTGPVPGVAEIVDELRGLGHRVLGLTNWSAETFHHAPAGAPAIGGLEAVVVSGREGVCKPSPLIFQLLVDRHSLDPHRTVFVDDMQPNVDASAALGFTGIRFVDANRLRDDLRRVGVLPGAP